MRGKLRRRKKNSKAKAYEVHFSLGAGMCHAIIYFDFNISIATMNQNNEKMRLFKFLNSLYIITN